MSEPYFFGYGSLVNRATHNFPKPRRATLKGWRRAWRHTDLRPVAFLTAVPDPACEIDGLIAHVPGNDWAALDEREWAYDRVPVTGSVAHRLTTAVEIAVYSVPVHRHIKADEMHPIYLSYLDVVFQGYLHEFGPEGVARFIATTDGWDTPIIDDRSAPRYPRAQALTPEQTAMVDEELARLGVDLRPSG